MNIAQKPTPNFHRGRNGYLPIAIVVHIEDGTEVGTDSWFANPRSHVSSHFSVSKTGEVHQYVDESNTAFHVGVIDHPSWPLIKQNVSPNFYTIGIEHEGVDGNQLTDAQKAASAALIAREASLFKIPLDDQHVIPHHAVRRGKTCPGSGVDVAELIAMASALSEPPAGQDAAEQV